MLILSQKRMITRFYIIYSHIEYVYNIFGNKAADNHTGAVAKLVNTGKEPHPV